MKSDYYLETLFALLEKERSKYKTMLEAECKQSGAVEGRTDRALEWAKQKLRAIGAAVEPCQASPGTPPLLIANLGKAPDKKTLLVYGHLDRTFPGSERKLFGRGVYDSKGPLLCLFAALEVHRKIKIEVPVNLRFVLEAMRECEAPALKNYIYRKKTTIFKGVNYICLLDSRRISKVRPFITWGTRGFCEFEVTVEGGNRDLHAGKHGGAVYEAMTDLVALLSSLVTSEGEILVPGLNVDVDPLTPQEEKDFGNASFDVDRFKNETGTTTLLHKEDKKQLQMHLVRYPSLSIHGVTTGNDSSWESIPHRVAGRFSIRLVPHQTVRQVERKVTEYLTHTMTYLKSPNKMALKMVTSEEPWLAYVKDRNFQAGLKALKRATKLEPETIREGATIPILYDLHEKSGKEVILLPVGRNNQGQNQSDVSSFLEGTKTICSYFYELAN